MRNSALAIAAVLGWTCTASAQPKPKPKTIEERLGELASRIDEAMRAAADSAAALKALQDLQRQISELRQDAERHKDVVRGYQETRRALEQAETRLGTAELQLAAIRLEMAGRGAVAGYEEGFYLQTPDRRLLLRFNGLLQGAYQAAMFAGGPYPDDGQLGRDQSSFLLRRAALAFSGHVYLRELTYRLELDFGSQDPGPILEGWADLRLHKILRLRGGKLKIPVGRQMLVHSSQLQFTERSGPVLALAPGWDLGAMLHGEIPLKGGFRYQVGIFNGSAPGGVENDNIDLLYAVRLTAEPLGYLRDGEGDVEASPFRFALGGSFAYNLTPTDLPLRKGVSDSATAARLSDKDADGLVDNVAVYTVGAELAARYAAASLQSELFYRREDAGSLGGDELLFGSYWGVYVQAGYFFRMLSSLELAARYSYWEPSFYGASRAVYRPGRVHEVSGVVNLPMWRRLIKWQLEYGHQWQRQVRIAGDPAPLVGGVNIHMVRLQVQAAF